MADKKPGHREVAAALRDIALLLELKGENPFKVRAYSNAGRSLEVLEENLREMIDEGRITELPGIGEAIGHQITELVTTGRLDLLEELKKTVPPGHLDMVKVPGLGPKKIRALYDALHLKTLGELEYACLENRLAGLQGFGQKSQEKILRGIQQVKKYQGQYLYGEVVRAAEGVLEKILSHPKVLRASLSGSLRRKMEVVRNINLLVSSAHPREVLKMVAELPEVEVVDLKDRSSGRYALRSGIRIDLQTCSDPLFPHRLYPLTGNLSHWKALVGRAESMGLRLSDEGLHQAGKLVLCQEEEEIFGVLGLGVIPPELRENQGEIEAAVTRQLPRLIENQEIRGVFHVHSLYSDGTNSIRAVAEAAKEMGLSYIGLSDHSPSARYAGGLGQEKLQKQWDEIDQVNEHIEGITLFKGTESDILPDGSLDYEEAVLKKFDFIIASVHSHFNMSTEEMTQRVIKALRNPYTTMLGHPTGRLLLAREPYAIDMPVVIDEAARTGVAIELNAHPYRLDIDWRLCRYAKERGAKIVINPDSHSREGLKDTYYGVGIARKGWLAPGDVLNTLNLEEMRDFLNRRNPWTRKTNGKG